MVRTIISLFLFATVLAMGQPAFHGNNFVAANLVAPAFNHMATNGLSGSQTSITLTGFTVSGANPYLVVAVCCDSTLTARTVSTVTANGVSMTSLVNTNYHTKGNVYIWGLANPGTGDIVATLSGAANNGLSIAALQFTGCNSVGAAAADFSSTARTSVSVAPSTVTTDMVVDALIGQTTWLPGASQTGRSTNNTLLAQITSTAAGTAGTTTMSWSGASSAVSQLAVVLHGM